MMNIHDEVQGKVEAFMNDISALIRRMALEAVGTALGGGEIKPPVVTKKAAPAHLAKAAPVAKKAVKPAFMAKAAAPAKKIVAPKRPVGAKRPPAEIAKLTERLSEFIKQNAGARMEAIGKGLGYPTSELTLPIKRLLAVKKIRFEGHRRATKYFPA
jgi:hypothetical protein